MVVSKKKTQEALEKQPRSEITGVQAKTDADKYNLTSLILFGNRTALAPILGTANKIY